MEGREIYIFPNLDIKEGTVVCVLQETNEASFVVITLLLLKKKNRFSILSGDGMALLSCENTTTDNNVVELKDEQIKVNNHCIRSRGIQMPRHNKNVSVINNGTFVHCIELQYASAGYLLYTLQNSKVFRRTFCKYCEVQCQSKAGMSNNQALQDESGKLPNALVCVFGKGPPSWLDYKWNYRLCGLLWRRVQLDDSMNWLNTLGGGYSALGDTFSQFAQKAGEISFAQLVIARRMCDQPTMIRCKLYFSLSLMQTGRLRQAKRLLRSQYELAKQFVNTDQRLMNTCHGVWSKLQYYYKHRPHTNRRRSLQAE